MNELAWEIGVWVVTGGLMLAGIAGTVMPFLPGHVLMLLAALIPWFALEDRGGLAWWSLVVLGLGFVLGQLVEFLSGAVGSKWFGGSRWGSFGAVAGGIVGLLFLPLGLLVGPLCGAFLAEWLLAKQETKPAVRSGVGSVIGTVTGMVLKFVIAVLMGLYFLAEVLWLGEPGA
ncbi:MAG: DUF456 domain-containing protein [Verrucomicrobiales bacterium]